MAPAVKYREAAGLPPAAVNRQLANMKARRPEHSSTKPAAVRARKPSEIRS